jgi:hypothetical protein
VGEEAVISCLKTLAAMKNMDTSRDFYRHPSIDKRIASLQWTPRTRIRRWYFEI